VGNSKFIVIFALLTLFITSVHAQEYKTFISNSAEWQDVYSVLQYSSITGGTGYFLVSTRHSTLLVNQLSKDSPTLVVTNSDSPYVVGYKSVLMSREFDEVEEVKTRYVNLEMARMLPDDVRDFIVIDDSYGYNAISVAPYAAISKSYVLFANRRNINQVSNFLESANPNSVILYGQLDREVKDDLQQFNPEIINERDRFLNNQKIVEKYQKVHKEINGEPKKQAILTNGEFIEQEIMSGIEPVVFIGRSNVPDQVADYIKGSDIDIGILIGNELIGSATFIRQQLGISVFVKFAQSARAPSSTISPVEDLDRFYLPRYVLNIDVFQIRYNRATNKLEVTYANNVDLSAFLKGTITLRYDGETQVVGDEDPVFIDKGAYKTLIYDVDPMQGDITAEIFTIFGESPLSLEYTLRKEMTVEAVDIQDNSRIELGRIIYDKRAGKFLIEVINKGETSVFVDAELIDILINDELVTIGSDEVIFIEAGESEYIEVTIDMDEADFENNPTIRVRAYYGERERNLIHVIEGDYEYTFAGFGFITGQAFKDLGKNFVLYMPLIIIIVLLILILGMKKKCPHCGEINKLRSKHCKRCSARI